MPKNKQHKHKKDDHDINVSEELAEEVMKDIFEKAKKRRILIRKPTGEVIADIPLVVSGCMLVASSIFFLPLVIIAVVGAYAAKLRVDIITELTDEEAALLDNMDQHTAIGINYESGDGQATLIQ